MTRVREVPWAHHHHTRNGVQPLAVKAPLGMSPALLLARIVLFLAFLPVGLSQLGEADFTGEDAARVERLMNPIPAQPTPVTEVSLQTDETVSETVATKDSIKARRLYAIALHIESAGLGSPVLFAWIAVLVAVIGSGLILIGVVSRVWALGLVVLAAGDFMIGSMPDVCASTFAIFSMPTEIFNAFIAQTATFALAVIILLCGPGGFSLDRLLFGGHASRRAYLAEDDEDGMIE